MRRILAALACACACVLTGSAQQTPPQTPVFRGQVDIIRLDVSVLDKDHRPIRGLTAADFTVFEEGKAQRIVAVSEIDAVENDPAPTAWMRHVTPDIATNDLADQLGDGRLFAIVMDDFNTPWEHTDMVMAARAVGREIVERLGPSDLAAVVFPVDAGRTQDFTTDRDKLVAAIDRFEPREHPWVSPTPLGPGPGGGDMPQRFSPALMRTTCQRSQPTVPTLHVVASQLAAVPNRRKTVIVVSPGLPFSIGASRGCPGELSDEMRDVFRIAQRNNINIHSVDPAGARGYEDYLQNPVFAARRMGASALPTTGAMSQQEAHDAAKLRRDFLEVTADNTGAHAVVSTNEIAEGVDSIFAENAAYYLVGYQTSNGAPDGKFRKVNVRVNRSDVVVHTRSGYYAARADTLLTPEPKTPLTANDISLSGMTQAAGVALRATAWPIAPAGAAGRDVMVGAVLTVRLPPARGPIEETLTITRNVYDADGKPGPPIQEKRAMTLQPSAGDELRFDMYYKLTMAPGRYQVRFNVRSAALNQAGSVFADIMVPDFRRPTLSLSGIALGVKPVSGAPRDDALAAVLPIVPTSARDFAPSDSPTAFVRVQQGADLPAADATVAVRILDVNDATKFETTATIRADAFDANRGAPFQIELPLGNLAHGPYLLSVTATLPGGSPVRRDLVFRVR